WRNFAERWVARRWTDEGVGIILSSGGGAMGVRLGSPQAQAARVVTADMSTVDTSVLEDDNLPGEQPGLRALQSTVGLVWRALLLWMLLLLLLSSAIWFG
ncbi:MAG TPA: cobalamin biosynthesis protein CobD, partial [Rubrivivax sp.]|nr:cobalamin biosynthesis protein CobD [Rubrivivax sp.]